MAGLCKHMMQTTENRETVAVPDTEDIWRRLITAIADIHTSLRANIRAHTCFFDLEGFHLCVVKCWPDEVMLCCSMSGDRRYRICHFYEGEDINYRLIRDTIMGYMAQITKHKTMTAPATGAPFLTIE